MSADIWKIKMVGELLRGGDIYLIAISYFVTVSQHVNPALVWSECFSWSFANMRNGWKKRENFPENFKVIQVSECLASNTDF